MNLKQLHKLGGEWAKLTEDERKAVADYSAIAATIDTDQPRRRRRRRKVAKVAKTRKPRKAHESKSDIRARMAAKLKEPAAKVAIPKRRQSASVDSDE